MRAANFSSVLRFGLAGVIAACKNAGPDASAEPHATLAAQPRLRKMRRSQCTRPMHPRSAGSLKHDELVLHLCGAAPRQRIKPGTRIISWTEDCFDGAAKTAADLPSKVMTPGHDNPQTGPFYIEGAEPGDTVAVSHHQARARAVRTPCRSIGPASARSSQQPAACSARFPNRISRFGAFYIEWARLRLSCPGVITFDGRSAAVFAAPSKQSSVQLMMRVPGLMR